MDPAVKLHKIAQLEDEFIRTRAIQNSEFYRNLHSVDKFKMERTQWLKRKEKAVETRGILRTKSLKIFKKEREELWKMKIT